MGYADIICCSICCNSILAGGILTRVRVIKKKGLEYFEKRNFLPKFDGVTTAGLLLMLVLLFSFRETILNNPLHILLIAVPLTIQTFFIFFLAYGAAKLMKLPFKIAAPAGMIGASFL